LNTAATEKKLSIKQTLTRSLQGRMLLASILCLPLFTIASGLLLEKAYEESLLTWEQQQLSTQLYTLLAAAEWQEDGISLPTQLTDPRFNALSSGLYGRIRTSNKTLWSSPSSQLLEQPLPDLDTPFEAGNKQFQPLPELFSYRHDLLWETEQGEQPLQFELFHHKQSYWEQTQAYRDTLWFWLGFLSISLLIVQWWTTRWGITPLWRLAEEIRQLPQQQRRRLKGNYPLEVNEVTESLNQLLSVEEQQRQRYQNTLGDLAHSLKTPLTILRGELQQHSTTAQDQFSDTASAAEQLQRMDDIIRYQLQRAVLSSQHQLSNQLKLKPVISRLCNAMTKIHPELELQLDIANDLSYPIEQQELFELLGNLIENGCKYGRGKLSVSAQQKGDQLQIAVCDNGPGVPQEQQHTILQRGARADSAQPGQGIGLAVTTDIISSYNGSLTVDRDPVLGGAKFIIGLPCA
jgi:two-component system, OmpR family, sensor histidine kinase PhoQ